MNQQVGLIDALKERGVRVTPQRAMILQAIETMPGHLTAEDVYRVVHEMNPYVNLATVYRTLELLRGLDLIGDADMGAGATHFALRSHGNHHHAVCRGCQHALEFPAEFVEPLAESLLQRYEFSADANHLVIFGMCCECRQRLNA